MSQASKGPERDLILMGGSAGAIEALQQVLVALPAEFAAAIFVVVHTSADGPALLPRVLTRAGSLPATYPADGDPIRPGKIYVAPPDHHLTLAPGNIVHVSKGPRENGHRPAIDPLLRSAAAGGYAPRAIAVVLSGYLDDGAAGLYAVRRRKGLAIVQDPKDAMVPEMPLRALQYAGADYVLPAVKIGKKLSELAGKSEKVVTMTKQKRSRVTKSGKEELPPNSYSAYPGEGEGTPSVFSCPECSGVLWEIKEGGSVRYRCRTGHAYSEVTLNEEMSRATETALWAAMRALEEKASMARRMADTASGPLRWKTRLHEQAQTLAAHAEMIRRMIFGERLAVDASARSEPVERNQAG